MGVCLCVFEKSQVVLSRDCSDSVYTSSALASEWIFIGAVGSSRRGVGMDSYSTKASPWLRNAFVNLFQEVRNRKFYSRPLWIKNFDFQVAVQVTEPDDRSKMSSRVKS